MEFTVSDLSAVKKKIEISVDQERIQGELDKSMKKYRKKAKVKGFRPGKVPLNIVKNLYFDQIRAEVMEDLVQKVYLEALNETKLIPLAFPEIANLSFGDENDYLSYEAIIEVKPQFELEGYLGLELEREPVEVTDQDREESMENLRQAYAHFATVEDRPAKEGDTLIIDFVGKVDGEEFTGGSASEYTVEIGSGSFIPDLEKQLVGLKLNETRDLEVTFPEDYHHKELAGKPAVFTVTVNEIKEKKLPEINDDFAADVSTGQITSLDELKNKLEEGIKARKDDLVRRKLVDDLLAKLRDLVEFEIPECLVESEKKSMIEGMKSRYQSQGIDAVMVDQMVAANQEKIAEDAARTVKNTLILEQIADREKMTATQDEINNQLQKFIAQSGQNPQALREYFQGREAELQEMLHNQALMDKLIDYLLEKATYVESELSD
ncbi:MAG TPA: trigger factor [Proteobacteria bacterium]|nr:trigger factor [Pseudomonadota bacterium]